MTLKNGLCSLLIIYAIIWAACTGAAVFSGGVGLLTACLGVAQVLVIPMCVSAVAICAVFLLPVDKDGS